MFGTKSRTLIVLGRSQLPAELAVCRQAVGEASLGAEVYLPSELGRTARRASLETAPSTFGGPTLGHPRQGVCDRSQKGQTWSTQGRGQEWRQPPVLSSSQTQAHLSQAQNPTPSVSLCDL